MDLATDFGYGRGAHEAQLASQDLLSCHELGTTLNQVVRD